MSKADCRKFVPNIFNKSKCATCFKAKDEHSEEALENNRASRKVAKCGYLFVAPDWDFSNPINRTKRWQRRWFVLYDDGELTYSVDEHPETVPQAIIDMNRVVEVSEAEEVTGHPFSLALTAADRVHFLKGTSREESKWWFDVLSMFPRTNMKTGRHKRNATFPGSKATTIPSQQTTAPNSPCLGKGVTIQPFQTPPMARPRFHSCHTEPASPASSSSTLGFQNFNLLPVKDTNGKKMSTAATGDNNNKTVTAALEETDVIPVKELPSPSTTKENNPAAEKDLNILDKDLEEKFKTRRVIRREIRGARSARCNSEILSSMLIQSQQQQQQGSNNKAYAIVVPTPSSTSPSSGLNKNSAMPERPRSALLLPPTGAPRANGVSATNASSSAAHSPFYLYMADVPRNRHYESLESLQHDRLTTPHITTGSKLTDIRGRSSKETADSKIEPSPAHGGYLSVGSVRERPLSLQDLGTRLAHYNDNHSRPVEASCIPASEAATRPSSGMKSPGEAVRGDPDGCGLDPIPSFCSPLPDRRSTLSLSSSSTVIDEANVKKGWLLKMSYSGDWNKCWFVLRGQTLSCFSDHAAEDANRVDETVDLGEVFSVDELDIGRSYGFQLLGFDGKKYSLAALTSGIRTLWVQALRNASNQSQVGKSQMQQPQSKATMKAEKENVNPDASAAATSTTSMATATMVAAGDEAQDDDTESMESFDDEQQTTTSSDESDSQHDEFDSPNAMASLPPSPPLNRTPISKVKERDRSRSSSRSRSRHRSLSPPATPSRDRSPPPLLLQQQPQPYLAVGSDPRESGQLQLRLEAAKGEITKLLTERRDQEKEAKQQLTLLTQRLTEKEQHVCGLINTLETSRNESQRQLLEMRTQLEAKESELKAVRDEATVLRTETTELRESLKCERSEVYKLRDVAQELRSLLDSRNDILDQLQGKSDEVDLLKKQLSAAQQSLADTQERLQRGIDENEGLFARLRQMEGQNRTQNDRYFSSSLRRSRSSTGSMPLPLQLCSHLSQSQSSKKSLPRLDSLSDLSNIDYDLDLDNIEREHLVDEYIELRARFEKAVQEIRALKRELKQTQSSLDSVEVAHMAMKQQWQAKENDYTSQLELMAARIQDLTSKMGVADKQVRQLKVKVAKSENREKRRTQSLKGRESFQLSKEVEEKLVELEGKMAALVGVQPGTSEKPAESSPARHRKGFEETTKSFRLRRKSLDGGGNDSVKILLRVEQLEQQLSHTNSGGSSSCSSSVKSLGKKPMERKGSFHGKSPQGKPPRATSLVKSSASSSSSTTSTLKRTDSQTSTDTDISGSVKSTKTLRLAQDLEQCLMELELMLSSQQQADGQSLISKIRQVQQELLNGEKSKGSVSGSTTVSEGQSQLDKIQELLRVRLSELKVKRDHVRNMGKLDSAAVSQIAAEKLALELTIAEQLFGLVKQPEQKECVRDAHWTIQKLNWLRRKLVGEKSVPALEQSTSFGTYCAALAERMSAVAAISSSVQRSINNGTTGGNGSDPADYAGSSSAQSSTLPAAVAQHLADEERDLSQLFARYKEEKLQELARLLAYETIRMGDNQAGASDNQLVEEVKVREAWLQAQDVANKELVDSEVRQAMMRMAEVFAEDVAAEERLAAALLFWPTQQMQYEQRCQVVEEVLRQEMEEAVLMLSNAYEKCLQQMRIGGLPQTDGDLESLLSEFAEIVAHKALVDGHIAVLQGESPASLTVSTSDLNLTQNVAVIQQTENIIAPLCSKGIGSSDFFPSAMNCIEVAAIIHRNLVERRGWTCGTVKGEQSNDSAPINPQAVVNEELIRQKYQGEIEQLRALTEKGMSAMETTHKRIIAELEEKHRQELARLQVEKERALAEETQATLAALDAMRKAHEAEVQREIGRFKEEFLRQMATRQESTQQHEKEMQEIRREILSLSERYSHKCLESAALEQKVSSISGQLAVAQRQISDLDARNQQLRAFIETDMVQCDQPDVTQTQLLRTKESQLLMLQEDVAELQFCLRESQTREEELATLARQLGQYLRTERPLRPDEVSALRHRLEEQLLLSGPSSSSSASGRQHGSSGFASSTDTDRGGKSESPPREVSRFHYVRSKDLTRSPSCPRLSGFLSLAPRLTTRSVLQRDQNQTLSGPSTNSSSSN